MDGTPHSALREAVAQQAHPPHHNHGPPGTTRTFVSDTPQHFPSGLPPPLFHNHHQQHIVQQPPLPQHHMYHHQRMGDRFPGPPTSNTVGVTPGITPGITPGGGNYLHHAPFPSTSVGTQANTNTTQASHHCPTSTALDSAQHRPTHRSTFTYGRECVCLLDHECCDL